MIGLQGMLIGGAALAAVSAFTASQVQHKWDEAETVRQVDKVKAASAKLIDAKIQENLTMQAERDQAKGEVAKVNAETARQQAANQALLSEDEIKRQDAALRAEASASQAAREVRALSARFTSSLEAIKNVADECARAPVSADARRLLNDILKPTAP